MTEEETEYDGGCWAWVLTIFGGVCLLGGEACFAAHLVWDIGNRKTMIVVGAALRFVGAICLGFGIKNLSARSANTPTKGASFAVTPIENARFAVTPNGDDCSSFCDGSSPM